jgi:hypothetical protein
VGFVQIGNRDVHRHRAGARYCCNLGIRGRKLESRRPAGANRPAVLLSLVAAPCRSIRGANRSACFVDRLRILRAPILMSSTSTRKPEESSLQ